MNSLASFVVGAARRLFAARRRTPLIFCVLAVVALAGAAVPGLTARLAAASPQEHGQAAPPAAEPQAAAPSADHQGETPAPSAEHQAAAEHQPAGEHQAGAAEHEGGGEHHESPWAMVARLFNFLVLAGGLVYFLRSPAGEFLKNRGVQIRAELAKAAEMREQAAAQLAAIDQRLASLPAELEALKQRGAEEIKAEEARMREVAQQERERMLSQARREIDVQLKLAERELQRRAGELSVDIATARVKQTINDADQARLVDRYLRQVRN